MSRKAAQVEQYADALADWAELNPLRRFRRTNKVSLRHMGVMLRVSEGTLRSWEIGSMMPSGVNMEKITAVTGITPDAWQQWQAGMPAWGTKKGA